MKLVFALALFSAVPLYAQREIPSVITTDEAQPTARVTDAVHPKQHPDKILLGPWQMRHFYALEGIHNQGEGQTIAIIGAHHNPVIEHDLQVFSSRFGLLPCTFKNKCLEQVAVSGAGPSGWTPTLGRPVNDDGKPHGYGEEEMDMEWAHAMAPAAHLMLVEGPSGSWPDYVRCVQAAVEHGATVVSLSLAEPEREDHKGAYLSNNKYFTDRRAVYVASGGDHAHTARWPASSPDVVGIGGTTITTNAAGERLGEIAWTKKSDKEHATGTGGGTSIAVPEPQAQIAFGLPGNAQHMRGTPDVSLYATGKIGIAVYNSNTNPESHEAPLWHQSGGTSAGAPMWAGLLATINSMRLQAGKKPLSQFDGGSFGTGTLAAIYTVGKQHPEAFLDITEGTNGDCGDECKAGPGYDYLTGLGSPNGKVFVDAMVALP
ncbi:MAG: S53 family peptidase [Acidobacteriaceae bacterium]|nr:S53 family peptidase [Acidobacteriaceae bacterium]